MILARYIDQDILTIFVAMCVYSDGITTYLCGVFFCVVGVVWAGPFRTIVCEE